MNWDWLASGGVFWIALAVMVVGGAFFRHRSQVAKYKMMETLAQKGQPIPPEMFDRNK